MRPIDDFFAAQDELFDLSEHLHPPILPKRPVLKREPKLCEPKLDFADYVASEAQPPVGVHRSHLSDLHLVDSLGNADWGDCGDAMAIHGIEAFHLDTGMPVPPFATPDALALYSKVSGFDPNAGPPGSNPTDTGTDNQQLVDYWRNSGIVCAADGSVHKIAGSVFVDPQDERLTRLAIWEFVALFRALGLPKTAQGQSEWKLTDPSLHGDAAVGSWGYHDVPYFSYDPRRIRTDSWGQPLLVDWAFDRAYAVQGIAVVTTDQFGIGGMSPTGVDWTKLNDDLSKFPAVPS